VHLTPDLYYLAFPKDSIYNKILVYTIFTIEVVQTLFIGRDMFAIFVLGFGDLSVLTQIHFAWLTLPIFGGVGK